MKTRKELIGDLAAATVELFADGIGDPSAKQIADRYWADGRFTPGMVDDVRRLLPRIREVLAQDGDITCPLSSTYYRRFYGPKRRPRTGDEARRCLPGRGRQQDGLYKLGADPDLDIIWQEHMSWQMNAGAAKVGRSHTDVLAAYRGGQLTGDAAREIEREALILARFERPEQLLLLEASTDAEQP